FAVTALSDALEALHAKDLNCLLDVALSLNQSVLAVDHASAKALAQFLHSGHAYCSHVLLLNWNEVGCKNYSAAGVSAAASAAGASPSAAASTAASAGASVLSAFSSSTSHSASGSAAASPSAGFWWRSMRPSAAASAMTRVSSATERIASSLPGIG